MGDALAVCLMIHNFKTKICKIPPGALGKIITKI
jgi:hypothetical protein